MKDEPFVHFLQFPACDLHLNSLTSAHMYVYLHPTGLLNI